MRLGERNATVLDYTILTERWCNDSKVIAEKLSYRPFFFCFGTGKINGWHEVKYDVMLHIGCAGGIVCFFRAARALLVKGNSSSEKCLTNYF